MIDINTLRSIFTLLLFILFIAICIWAYSKRRKQEFEDAANIPFQADEISQPLEREKP